MRCRGPSARWGVHPEAWERARVNCTRSLADSPPFSGLNRRLGPGHAMLCLQSLTRATLLSAFTRPLDRRSLCASHDGIPPGFVVGQRPLDERPQRPGLRHLSTQQGANPSHPGARNGRPGFSPAYSHTTDRAIARLFSALQRQVRPRDGRMGHDARVTLKRVCILSRGGDSERKEIAAYGSALTDTTHGCGRPHDSLAMPTMISSGQSGRRDSNARQPAWKAGALPTELRPQSCHSRGERT